MQQTDEKRVSVIIPSYNRYDLLHHSVQSVIDGTHKNIEIIIVNDCSTDPRYYDGSLEKMERTKVVHLPQNSRNKYKLAAAQGAVRQAGVECATGDFVAFLDDDDFFLPNKIEAQLAAMARHDVEFSCTNAWNIEHDSASAELSFKVKGEYYKFKMPELFERDFIEAHNLICTSSVIMSRALIARVGPMRAEIYEDWKFWLRALEQTTHCLYLDEPLVLYSLNTEKLYRY